MHASQRLYRPTAVAHQQFRRQKGPQLERISEEIHRGVDAAWLLQLHLRGAARRRLDRVDRNGFRREEAERVEVSAGERHGLDDGVEVSLWRAGRAAGSA